MRPHEVSIRAHDSAVTVPVFDFETIELRWLPRSDRGVRDETLGLKIMVTVRHRCGVPMRKWWPGIYGMMQSRDRAFFPFYIRSMVADPF